MKNLDPKSYTLNGLEVPGAKEHITNLLNYLGVEDMEWLKKEMFLQELNEKIQNSNCYSSKYKSYIDTISFERNGKEIGWIHGNSRFHLYSNSVIFKKEFFLEQLYGESQGLSFSLNNSKSGIYKLFSFRKKGKFKLYYDNDLRVKKEFEYSKFHRQTIVPDIEDSDTSDILDLQEQVKKFIEFEKGNLGTVMWSTYHINVRGEMDLEKEKIIKIADPKSWEASPESDKEIAAIKEALECFEKIKSANLLRIDIPPIKLPYLNENEK